MKRRWAAWFLGLLGVTTSGCDTPATSAQPTAEPPGGNAPEAAATTVPTPAPTPSTPTPAAQPSDPYAPMRIANMNTMPPPPDAFANGRRVRGTNSGPVNTDRADVAFFTDPRFSKGENSGRLFYNVFYMENPHDPHIPERRIWFICWSPPDDGDRAQRLYIHDGYTLEEVTTDGKSIRAHHTARVGEGKKVDVYRWKGNGTGQGRFVLEGKPPSDAIPPKRTPFDVERDQGYYLLSERQYDEAIAAFKKALALKPNDAATHFALGVAYEESGMNRSSAPFTKAIEEYGKAIAADPKRTAAYQHRATLYVSLKQYDAAIADMNKLIAAEPKDWDGYMVRARAYAKKGDYAKAIADTQKALEIVSYENDIWAAMALYQYRAGKFTEAIATGQKALSKDDSQTDIRITMACAYARLGKADQALKVYEDAKNNGVGSSERRAGIRELQRVLKSGNPTSAARSAIEKLVSQFSGPEQYDALDDEEDIGGL